MTKVLVLKTLIIQTETFSPQYKYPFGEFVSFHLLRGVETKNDDLRRYFHRKSNRWDAVTNLRPAEKKNKERTTRTRMGETGVRKKGDEAKQVRRI